MTSDLADLENYEFFRPLTKGWLSKIELALTSDARKKWKEVADECVMFYSRSAAAMWDPSYTRRVWRGIKAPKFRITINKAFELVAIFGPNLLWDIPWRNVTPKKALVIPPELFPDEQGQQFYQMLQGSIQRETANDKLIANLMQTWLNYTPREMPGGGLECHNELAVVDALVKGRGCLWPATYKMPGSQRTLTGCFRVPPEDLIIDPDFKTLLEARWIARRHVDPHWAVEKRFQLPAGSLKNKATLESGWHYGEMQSNQDANTQRRSGKTNDLVVWYEIWSKMGTGARMTGMPDFLKNQLEETVGDYAYLAVCPDCPYPLNCPADKVRGGASEAEIRSDFEWPVPLWTDGRWPVEVLDFYPDPDGPWPIAPLAPALGELKAMNCIVSWLVNRTHQAGKQMWAVLGAYYDDMKKQLEDGDDLSVFAIPPGQIEDVRKICQLIESKEVNKDSWQVLELLGSQFDKRTGLTEFAYGMNSEGTQDRTAETTLARKQAVGVRPDHMQKKVKGWQSRTASVEAMLTWMFVKAQDTQPLMGEAGAMLWQQHIENADGEQIMRGMTYEIAANSIRRPDKDRDIENLQEVMGRWLPVLQNYGETSGDYQPVNGVMEKWGELHDMDLSRAYIPAKDPNDPAAQLQQQLQQAEVAKTQAEAQKLQSEAQQNPAELKAQELQMKGQIDQQKLQMDMAKTEAELKADIIRLQMEMEMKKAELEMKAQEHQQDMQFKAQESAVDLQVKQATGMQQIQQGRQQMELQKKQGEQQVAQTKQQGDAKVSVLKAQAKAKPKPTNGKVKAA